MEEVGGSIPPWPHFYILYVSGANWIAYINCILSGDGLKGRTSDSFVNYVYKFCVATVVFSLQKKPAGRIELPTFCLQSRCSATKLSWRVMKLDKYEGLKGL